jgi:Holliday junction DNA helicase RuvA
MIARLAGRIVEREPQRVVIDVNGLGYGVAIPLSTYYTLPHDGEPVTLRIHTHVKEDSIALYGFATREEQVIFERLIEISGIGPRLGLAILSGLPVQDLVEAIAEGEAGKLRSIPGIGPKTADRVVLEMRDRVRQMLRSGSVASQGGSSLEGRGVRNDVISALLNLGYRQSQAEDAVGKAMKPPAARQGSDRLSQGGEGDQLQDVLRRSLRYLAS